MLYYSIIENYIVFEQCYSFFFFFTAVVWSHKRTLWTTHVLSGYPWPPLHLVNGAVTLPGCPSNSCVSGHLAVTFSSHIAAVWILLHRQVAWSPATPTLTYWTYTPLANTQGQLLPSFHLLRKLYKFTIMVCLGKSMANSSMDKTCECIVKHRQSWGIDIRK